LPSGITIASFQYQTTREKGIQGEENSFPFFQMVPLVRSNKTPVSWVPRFITSIAKKKCRLQKYQR